MTPTFLDASAVVRGYTFLLRATGILLFVAVPIFDQAWLAEVELVVVVLVAIMFVGSVLPVLAGAMILTGGEVMPLETYFLEESLHEAMAYYYVVIGLVGLVLAWGLWGGRGWAWTGTLIVAFIGILIGLVALPTGIMSVVIDGVVLYLLMRADTRAFCGK